MNLQFESLEELRDFLTFIDERRKAEAGYPIEPRKNYDYATAPLDAASNRDSWIVDRAEQIVRTTFGETPAELAPLGAESAEDDAPKDEKSEDDAPKDEKSEPAKRKRRTKAEMDAARAAEAGNPAPAEPKVEAATPTSNPFAQPTIPAQPAETAPPAPANSGDRDAWIKARAEALRTAEPIGLVEHLGRCKAAIGKHGVPAYNTSFELAGIDNNVAAYTDEQRIQHVAALDWLDQVAS